MRVASEDMANNEERELLEHKLEFWRQFSRTRRFVAKALIWSVFFFLLYLLRDFFPLIFLTFVFSFVTNSAARAAGRVFPNWSWKGRVVGVFLAFLVMASIFVAALVPQIRSGILDTERRLEQLPSLWVDEIDPWLYENVAPYRDLVTERNKVVVRIADGSVVENPRDLKTEAQLSAVEERIEEKRIDIWNAEKIRFKLKAIEGETIARLPYILTDVIGVISALLSLLFLSLIFSFLIVFDLKTLKKEVKKLEETKLDNAYTEVARDLVKFGSVLGKVLEAQAAIAFVNALLTAVGLWFFGLPNIVLFSLIVFLCGFIPVAGVFISSVPIILAGLYLGGPKTALLLVAFITGIHFLEAYVLNPRIMGKALHVNPVLVLIILVVGHHALGMWGLLLGLPICYYFFTHVIKHENPEIGLRVKFRRSEDKANAPSS
jgi:predicted PurR-regulated permease PerM